MMSNKEQTPQDALNEVLRGLLAGITGCVYADIEYRGDSSDGFFLHGEPLVSKWDLAHGLPDGPIIARANEVLAGLGKLNDDVLERQAAHQNRHGVA